MIVSKKKHLGNKAKGPKAQVHSAQVGSIIGAVVKGHFIGNNWSAGLKGT